jgi:hypothetical protein
MNSLPQNKVTISNNIWKLIYPVLTDFDLFQTLNVIEYDITYGAQEHPVRVLDCDTISQVKDKMLDVLFRNSPYSNSSRPRRDALDLGKCLELCLNLMINLPVVWVNLEDLVPVIQDDISHCLRLTL